MKRLIFIPILFVSLILSATNYYVKNGGSDAANGLTDATAWKSINKINTSTFSAGDTIFFNKDDVWRETLTVPSSGSTGNPIVFSVYGAGNNPIITGANLYSGFSDGGGNIWDVAATTQPTVVLKSKVLQTKVASRAAIIADGQWYWAGNVLSVYSLSDPSGLVEAGVRNRAMDENGKHYLAINELTFECANTAGAHMVTVGISSGSVGAIDVKFYNCKFQYSSGEGIFYWPGSSTPVSGGLVENCMIRYNWRDGIKSSQDGDITINNCTIYSNGLDPATAYNGIFGYLGDYKITNCDIYDNGRGLTSGPPHGIYQYLSDGILTITNCLLHDQPYGAGVRARTNVIIDKCRIYNNATYGLSIATNLTHTSTVIVKRTLFYNNAQESIEGSPSGAGNSLTLYNNTFYGNGSGAAIIKTSNVLASLIIKNNIIYSISQRFIEIDLAPDSVVIDYNIYYRSDANTNRWRWVSSHPTTLDNWKALGFDAHGYYADPLFISNSDYHLQVGSPAISAGVDVGLTEDYDGHKIPYNTTPDIGAYE